MDTRKALEQYRALEDARRFFGELGYPAQEPIPWNLSDLPEGARQPIAAAHQVVHLGDISPLRVFHVTLNTETIRRTDVRRFLESFYRHYSQGENLFVFSLLKEPFDELLFVSPKRLLDPRDETRVRLWLRFLPVRPLHPYRTDLEVLEGIRADGIKEPQEIWRRHEEAFSVQRVSEQFFRDYSEVFNRIRKYLAPTHRESGPEWARDYTHQLLNRIMFLYFIARKGWLLGPNGRADRDFMRHFWEAYREARQKGRAGPDTFHSEWLPVLFFEAFNNRWQNRPEYLGRFPNWLVTALSQAPYLNGGLYQRRELDNRLREHLPDDFFELLFEHI